MQCSACIPACTVFMYGKMYSMLASVHVLPADAKNLMTQYLKKQKAKAHLCIKHCTIKSTLTTTFTSRNSKLLVENLRFDRKIPILSVFLAAEN